MFKKTNTTTQVNDQQISTIIGEDYVFTGEFRGSSAIRVEGKIIGNVNIEGTMVLGEKGIIEGDVTSRSFIIYGTVTGNIKTAQLEIKKTGLVYGDITADTLAIELGAKYNGKLKMDSGQLLKAS